MSEEQKPSQTNPDNPESPFGQSGEAQTSTSVDASLESNSPAGEASSDEPQATTEGESLTPEAIVTALQREMASLTERLNDETQQVESFKKRYISLAAEFDNFRKRTQKEKEELEIQAKSKTIAELLSVVDNFDRARTQLKPATDGEMGIHKSYQSVYKNLVDGLKRLGVSAMRPEGQPFDPSYHEAMLREYTDDYPEGTVIEQLVRGYLLGDQVLRHAMVKVAAAKDPDGTSEASENYGSASSVENSDTDSI